jgi:hypothetical protein
VNSIEPIQSASTTPTKGPEDESDDTDIEEIPETDKDRRQTMMTSMDALEANQVRTGTLTDFWGDFILPKRSTGEGDNTGSKATGNDGLPHVNLQRAGNTSATSAPARTRADPVSSKFTPAQEELQHEGQGSLGHVAAKPLDTRLSNSTHNLKVGNELRATREDTMWPCLVCTL